MDGKYRQHLVLVVFAILSAVDDVSAQTSCVISPDLDMLTIRNGLGRDVELHCQCMDTNGIITGTRWFFPNMSVVSTDSSARPYSTGTAPSRLIFTDPFTNSDAGTYTCSPDSTFPIIPPGDSITLNTAANSEGDVNCNIVSTNLPTVTSAGGVIANGTQNVIVYCICNRSNVAAGRPRWFLNGSRITLARDDGSGSPYVRDILPSTLIISSFVAPHNGIYSCGTTNRFSDISSSGDSITLALLDPTATGIAETTTMAATTATTAEVTTSTTLEPSSTPIDNVSAQTSCVISPDLDVLTIRNPLGRDVELHCQCMDDNGIITGTRWFLPNMSIVSTDDSIRPYSTGTSPSRLIIVSMFTNSDTGTYTCSPNNTFPTIPPGDSITLNTLADPNGDVNCNIVSTNLPTVTAAGGVIANGTQNVILYCICMRNNSNVTVGLTRWFFNGVRINLTQDDGGGNPYFRNNVPSPLIIPSFVTPHDGNYSCTHNDNFNEVATLGDTITLTLPALPPPNISVTVLNNTQTVGQSLTLLCEVTTVRGITSRVDIVWRDNIGVLRRRNDTMALDDNEVSSTIVEDVQVYTNSYTISQLSTTDDGRVIHCEGVINTRPPVMGSSNIILNVTAPTPNVTLNLNPAQPVMVGSQQTIECRVDTVPGVTTVSINWTGPRGVTIMNSSRMSISPTTSNGTVFTSILQFEYLAETDNGTYTCNWTILENSGSMSVQIQSLTVPAPTVSVTAPNNQTVGQSLTLPCNVTTVRGINGTVDFMWSSNGTVLRRTNGTAIDNSVEYTDSYTISQLNITDDGRVIQCEVVINASLAVMANDSITLDVTVPTPDITISPSGPIQGAMVGSPQIISCTVSTVSGVESSSVMISWMGPRGNITNDSRVTISPTTSSGNTYTSTLQFTYLAEGDNGSYICNVMILDTTESQPVALQSLTIPDPNIGIVPITSQTVGQSLTMECSGTTTARGITSDVDLQWRHNGSVVNSTSVSTNTMDNLAVYRVFYTITQLSTSDDNGRYICRLIINSSPAVRVDEEVTLNVTVPTPTVTISPIQGAMVGSPQVISCTVSTVSGVELSSVMISWIGPRRNITNDSRVTISPTTFSGKDYTSNLKFEYLAEVDEGNYTCNVMILDTSGSQSFELKSLTIPTPAVTISPPGPIQNITVGSRQAVNCTVSTVSGVESSSVMISWMGPGGAITTTNGRVSIGSITDDGNNMYTRSLQFTYLMEGDEGTYTCNVRILGTNGSNSTEIQSLAIPPPTVSVTALSNQTVGQSLTLQCEVTIVRGITSDVDIVWRHGGTELQRMNDVSSTMMSNSLVYTNSYTISLLSTANNSEVIQCEVVINVDRPVMASGSTTLAVSVPTSSVMISQSVDSPNVGDILILNCTVTVTSGVSSLVMVNWDRQDLTSPSSSISNTSISGSQYTRTITFSPLLSDDGGQYTCSGSVDGFDEANNSASVMVAVNGLPTVTVMPSSQSKEVTTTATFTTTVTGVGTDNFTYQWRHNGTNISEATNNTLILTNLMPNNTGEYNCTVMNQYGDIASSVASLTVTVTPPVITMHPMNASIDLFTNFTNHTLTCDAEAASSYNWERQNGIIPSDSTGVNTNTLTLINLQPEDTGNYRCVATNASGSSASDYASITINVPPPRIIEQPMDITRPVTEDAMFTCVGQGYGFVDVSWYRERANRNPVEIRGIGRSSYNIMVTPDHISSTLTISDLLNRDERNYWCRFDNNIGHVLSRFTALTIGVPLPDVILHPMDMTVDNGSNVTFICVSSSFAPVNYTWLKNGEVTSNGVVNNVNTSSGEGKENYTTTLTISDVQLSDNGKYICNATNENGTSSSNPAILSIIIPPVFTLQPESNVTNEMGRVELSCTATSIAPVMFQWERLINNTWEPFNGSARLIVDSTTDNGTAYTSNINSINILQSDEGSYRCTASNSAGTNISDVATITVYGPPMIVFLSNDTTVVEGESVSFVCEANNDLNATINITIRWFDDNGHGLINNNSITISTTMETGPSRTVMSTLTIDPVIHQDDGRYKCEALNHHELTVSRTTELTVEFPPIVTIVAMDKMNQSEVNVTLNDKLNMTCKVESYPLAMIHWVANGEQVSDVALVMVNTSVRGANITYTCVAVNEVNGTNRSANNSIDVIIQAVPGVIPTDDITQSKRTVTTVVVQWKEPDDYNAPITMYELGLCRKFENASQKLEDTSQQSQDNCASLNDYPMKIAADENTNASIVRYNITGLQPFISSSNPYQLTIRAINDIGPADFSEPVPITLVNRMEAAVQNLTLTTLNNSEVNATWDVNPDLFELSFFNVSYFIKPEQRETEIVTVNTYQISDLIPGQTYTVQVTAYYNGTPADTTEETVTLAKIDLTPPTEATLVPIVNNSDPAILRWTKPNLTDDNREFFQGYDVSFDRAVLDTTLSGRRKRNVLATETQTQRIGPDETSYNYNISCPYNTSFTLCPYSRYIFSVISVFAFRSIPIDNSELASVDIRTNESTPNGPPQELNYTSIGIREIGIRWNFPEFPNGNVTAFTVYYYGTFAQSAIVSDCDIGTSSCSYTIDGLSPYNLYVIEVSCSTRPGEGPRTGPIIITTLIGSPRVIDELLPVESQSISSQAITSLPIDIPAFDDSDGPISHYFIVIINATSEDTLSAMLVEDNALRRSYNPLNPYYVTAVLQENDYSPDAPFVLGDNRSTSFDDITYRNVPLTLGTYRYFVRAVTIGPGLSGDSDLTDRFTISRSDDSDSDATGAIIGAIAAVAVILLIVLIVLIILAIITRRRGKKTSATKLENSESIEMRKQASPASPAARNTAPIINTTTVEVITSVNQPTTLFIETSGNPPAEIEWSKDGSPVNHPIMSDGSLYIMHTEPSDQGEYTVTATNPVGVSQQSITVTVVQPVALHSDPDHKPVKKDDFAQHMALLRSDMEEGFKMEYESLDMAEWEFTQYNAKVTVNKNKNRYINIIPYDHSRVVLNIQDNTSGSDYINASFVNGQNERYIATQGPIPSSYGDFWRMIWENESATIIMLTNLKEDDRVKCHQYWPSYGSAMYGNFQVTLRDVENLAEYSVRVFSVQPIAASADIKDDMREVRQFHFTVWPDHGVPKYGTALLSFQKRIDKYHNRKKHGPMVVHCSAGVGRTGTFITIDTQLQKIKQEGILDIFNFVRHLRYCRNYMVQTQAQYVFLHDTILEALMCGDTSIAAPVKDAKDKVSELAKVNPRTGRTGFETQFENLTLSSPPENSFECNVARLPDNMRKNRFPNFLPSDVDRVVLSTDNDQPDYINACFLDGYRHRNAFIGTQGPMIETISDFWRMIWEHKSYAVIMLTELEENGREMCTQYWPDTGMTLTYGTCIVENISENYPRQEYITRNFRIALTSNPADTRNITQFQFQQWPVNACPNNPASIIDLLEAMERVQRKTGNGPITVHCNDGIGRTGTFCALAGSLERFKTEQMVDVFHTIKTIRIQRAGMVQTLEQYEFIHKTLLEYMTRFELYDNFS